MFEPLLNLANQYSGPFVCFCDENIKELYQEKILKLGPIFSFPPSEMSKSREMKHQLEDQLMEKQIGKESIFVAIGGGVTLDLIGYLASTYMRGQKLIFVPTTLLACIDASIGGKNGVNTPYGKNMIGTLYPPTKILIDLDFFSTLSSSEMLNGLAEGIKHGLIYDFELFKFIENNVNSILQKEEKILKEFIEKNVKIKESIVKLSEHDPDKRHLLNFGHTLGHAIESAANYSHSHGKAVFIGMLFALFLSKMEEGQKKRALELIDSLKLDLKMDFSIQVLIDKMKMDKKGFGHFVLLNEIGRSTFGKHTYFTQEELEDKLRAFCNEFADLFAIRA